VCDGGANSLKGEKMNLKRAARLALLISAFASVAFGQVPPQQTTVHDFRIGMTVSEMQAVGQSLIAQCLSQVDAKIAAQQEMPQMRNYRLDQCRKMLDVGANGFVFGLRPQPDTDIRLSFENGLLDDITVNVNGLPEAQFPEFVKNILVAKYGPYTSTDTVPVHNGFGAQWTVQTVTWASMPDGARITAICNPKPGSYSPEVTVIVTSAAKTASEQAASENKGKGVF
jgi:hypothetical protein